MLRYPGGESRQDSYRFRPKRQTANMMVITTSISAGPVISNSSVLECRICVPHDRTAEADSSPNRLRGSAYKFGDFSDWPC